MALALIILLALGALAPVAGRAEADGAEGGLRVAAVTPALSSGALSVEVECADLFSPKSLSTLQSGLSGVLRLELRLQRSGAARTLLGGGHQFETVRETELAQSISYDVWNERYTVRGPGREEVFGDLASAEAAVARFAVDRLVSGDELEAGAFYRINARAQLLPVSPEQGQRLAAWLHGQTRPDREQELAGGHRAGFGVGGLLSVLRGRSPNARDRSEWCASEEFAVSAEAVLQWRAAGEQGD